MSEGRSVRHGLTSPAHVIGRPAAAALAALATLLPGLAVELAARCKDRRPMAATNNVWREQTNPSRTAKRLRSVKTALLVHRPYYGLPVGFGIRIGPVTFGIF